MAVPEKSADVVSWNYYLKTLLKARSSLTVEKKGIPSLLCPFCTGARIYVVAQYTDQGTDLKLTCKKKPVSFQQGSISVSGCTDTSTSTSQGGRTSSPRLLILAAAPQVAAVSRYARPPLQVLTEHNVFSIQPVAFGARNEKLTPVGTWTTVCLGVENGKIQKAYNLRLPKTDGRHVSHRKELLLL